MTAGYSGTPLPRKLGISEGTTVITIGAPDTFETTLGALPDGVELTDRPQIADLFIVFATTAADMEQRFGLAMARIPADGAIWLCWPKKASGIATDITEQTLRDLFLPTGMVDNKVAAIDEAWSGLRFVVRRANRREWPQPQP